MQKALKQFVARHLKEPTEKQLDRDIEWACSSLLTTIEETRKEVNSSMDNTEKITKDIDDRIGLEHG